ncbi:replicative DNA helicase [Ureaplasma canigenitalium]|uniref:replicative DNA helicase n=1 Tax=Ureaplasma canigenitalium TaxID=42092 RepID=UPI0004E0B807|nr:DnaB family ATPase [Ureaplasma canigenitalium]
MYELGYRIACLTLFNRIINDPNTINDVKRIQVDDFNKDDFTILFSLVSRVDQKGKTISYPVLLNEINGLDDTQKERLVSLLNEVISFTPSIVDIKQIIEIIQNYATKRRLNEFASNILNSDISYIGASDYFDQKVSEINDIMSKRTAEQMQSLDLAIQSFQRKVELIKSDPKVDKKINSGFPSIDHFTKGFKPGELIILAARPGLGKTTLALNIIARNLPLLQEENISRDRQRIIVLFSFEMTIDEIIAKLISMQTSDISSNEVSSYRFTNNPMNEHTVLSVSELVKHWPLKLTDKNLTILDIESQLNDLRKKYDIALVVIDYLQLIDEPPSFRGLNRTQIVGNFSKRLKQLAKQIEAPILTIAQLSRKIEEREGSGKTNILGSINQNVPKLSDLRESGQIEQDADIVSFIHYDRRTTADDNRAKTTQLYNFKVDVQFIILKNRSGETGETQLLFNKKQSQFKDPSELGDERIK